MLQVLWDLVKHSIVGGGEGGIFVVGLVSVFARVMPIELSTLRPVPLSVLVLLREAGFRRWPQEQQR